MKLEDTICKYEVGHEATSQAWYEMVAAVAHCLISGHDVQRYIREAEDAARAILGVKTLCGAYRSAKSTVLSAVQLGVTLLDDMGRPRPKNAVSHDIKVAKKATSTVASMVTDSFATAWTIAQRGAANHSVDIEARIHGLEWLRDQANNAVLDLLKERDDA